jgi:hypothetical protein
MVEFLKTMAKNGFRLQRETGDQGVKPNKQIKLGLKHKKVGEWQGLTLLVTASSAGGMELLEKAADRSTRDGHTELN